MISKSDSYIKKQLDRVILSHINLSVFLRSAEGEIKALAKTQGVKIEISPGVLSAQGKLKDITSFQSALKDLEAQIKAPLYPTYWSHNNVEKFELVEISNYEEEFEMVNAMFKKTLPATNIVRLQRIQNTDLMEKFIQFHEKFKENNPDVNPNRRLLFHGTRQTDPEVIAKCPTGLDLQYARFGAYGKGLYFGSSAAISHNGYVHSTSNGTFKLMIVDVILGKIAPSGSNSQLTKAPNDCHSVEANANSNNSFHIIYNNYHSYPLYIVEYNLNQNPVHVFNPVHQIKHPVPKPLKKPGLKKRK